MITMTLVLSLVVSFLPQSTLGILSNEHLDIIQYAYARFVEEQIPPKEFIRIMNCESRFDKKAYNPELEAKKKGITKFSSCGLLQHNDKRCNDKSSELYDWRYSIELGIEKYKKSGFGPWLNCSKK